MDSENYIKCLEQWIRLDKMFDVGEGDSQEADDLRDEMDAPWYALTSAEHEKLNKQISDYIDKKEATE